MKKRSLVLAAAAALLALSGVAAYAFRTGSASGSGSWKLGAVEAGDLESVVSATGTLNAVRTVQVGTQISGLIESLLVDFNDRVKEGQVIARLDTTLLSSAVKDAEASLERATADLKQARRDLERLAATHAQGITSDSDFNKAQYNLDVAAASVKSAEVAVSRARQNLGYATIRAPVSGTVVERDVDVGQTVAASLSAPKLFLIANDLSEMQILASVDESDIGRVKAGQPVRFTVKAYAERTFPGTVSQVRLQSATDQNVVSYTVVVAVKNPDGLLLPGMTATVEFVTATAMGVLKVPNAALRFKPPQEVLAKLARARRTDAFAGERAARRPDGAPPGGRRGGGANRALLWTTDGDGALRPIPVRTGITDGQWTEVSSPELVAGTRVVSGTTKGVRTAEETKNPFQQQQRPGGGSGGPPPPPGGF